MINFQEFEVHMLTEKGKVKAKAIATAFNVLMNALKVICQDVDLTITRQKLEEACFYAKKAMARSSENHVTIDPTDEK